MPQIQFNFASINLGCNKNLVDTQLLLGRIFSFSEISQNYDINFFTDAYDDNVELVFLNTCGFISSGREEMLQEITQLLNSGKKIYVVGCGVQYFKNLDTKNIPEILKDENVFFISWEDFDKINLIDLKKGFNSEKFGDFVFPKSERVYTNLNYGYEYLKISEGCSNSCSFCIIPKIRGRQQSLPMEEIIEEAKKLIDNGINEIIILAQDTTRYGTDLYGEIKLFDLLKKINDLDGDFVFRLMYMYPDIITQKNLENLSKLEKFVPYFDIPLQHISKNVLKRMGRFYDTEHIKKLIKKIDQLFEKKYIRTNFIVGFPGETQEDFEELLNFVQEFEFNNITLFEYHDEKFAASSKFKDKVEDLEIRRRFEKIKSIVDPIIEKKSDIREETNIGYIVDILSENKIIVRPWLHSPEIDPYITIKISDIKGVLNESGNIDISDIIYY